MANLLKNMTLTSVDLCKRGANPDANIRLLKSADNQQGNLFKRIGQMFLKAAEGEPRETNPEENIQAVQECCEDMSKSLESIIADDTLHAVERFDKMVDSLQDFVSEITDKINFWYGTENVGKSPGEKPPAQINKGVIDLEFNLSLIHI